MTLRNLFKFGLPLSFCWCTIYQQNIWREVDDQLIEEQKRTWRNFFNLIDAGYYTTMKTLNVPTKPFEKEKGKLISKLDSMNLTNCWNSKVHGAFVTVDRFVSNPQAMACKIYRKLTDKI